MVRRRREDLPRLTEAPALLEGLSASWAGWAGGADIPAGTPYLISPRFTYDVDLNRFFYSADMLRARDTTRLGYARDLSAFLTFLFRNRGGRDWRDATESDHTAYLTWRRRDADGPRVSGSTWDRELSAVNRFYKWQVRQGRVAGNPIPQLKRRSAPVDAGGYRRSAGNDSQTPATYSHDSRGHQVRWFPAAAYLRWRDTGVRGRLVDGRVDPSFRGRWAARNATFTDLMVRTGLRLQEQGSLTTFELPRERTAGGYVRFWLPGSIAKGGSARWIYVPDSVVAELLTYADIDRPAVIAEAQANGEYRALRRNVWVAEPGRGIAARPGGATVKVSHLTPEERSRLLVDGPNGLEPAAFWLSERGWAVSRSTWKNQFALANARCARLGLRLHGHAHLLRHTFAVLTLEQLQRGHIAALGELNPEQRGHYTRIFGDPLDWVRRRLGHRSVATTQVYLHALEELEMETRMALVPDAWEDLAELSAGQIGEDPPDNRSR
jgi:integrase